MGSTIVFTVHDFDLASSLTIAIIIAVFDKLPYSRRKMSTTGASIRTELKSESKHLYIYIKQCMHAWNVITQRFIAAIIIIMYDNYFNSQTLYSPHTRTNNIIFIVDPNRHENLTVYIDEKLVFGEVFKGSYRGEICAVKVLHQVAMKMQETIPAHKVKKLAKHLILSVHFSSRSCTQMLFSICQPLTTLNHVVHSSLLS